MKNQIKDWLPYAIWKKKDGRLNKVPIALTYSQDLARHVCCELNFLASQNRKICGFLTHETYTVRFWDGSSWVDQTPF